MKVGIIDLKINNIFSIFKAMQLAGYNTYVIGSKESLKNYNFNCFARSRLLQNSNEIHKKIKFRL